MAGILIVYGTTEGHTARIARRMAETIGAAGREVALHNAKDIEKQTLTGPYEAILVGGSVHAGDHQAALREFVKRNRDLLEHTPSAFFSVSLAAADADAESAGDAQASVEKFTEQTGWHPARVELIAGALVFTQYNFFIRHLMKLIAKHHGRTELDTARDYDFTDWEAVDRFAGEMARSSEATAAGS